MAQNLKTANKRADWFVLIGDNNFVLLVVLH